ncbi:MAG: tRNA guanosine(34) transglycosylase Tgt [Anaerolineae bacterium]|nr:tRNA guanosine(34) transglycosylase Tgt [Anaerolineae bacterium]
MTFSFKTLHTHGRARTGTLTTPHGTVYTPAMTIVATRGTVKAVTARDLLELGVQLVIANTYHLMLRPGAETVETLGGLHEMMAWPRTTFTDSGGFQVFSLGSSIRDGVGKVGSIFPDEDEESSRPAAPQGASLVKIDEDGVAFRSHIDGSPQRLGPESSLRIQAQLGADIVVAFDECTSPLDSYDYTKEAMERTHRWAVRSLDAFAKYGSGAQRIYGIVQGGAYEDLRVASAVTIGALPFWGCCIGGSLGKSKADMFDILDWTLPRLPPEKPRHLLGIGEIEDIFQSVARGIDTFDCIIPTRWARNGWLMLTPPAARAEYPDTPQPRCHLNILNAKHDTDRAPIDPHCTCFTCRNHSRGYLRHLFKTRELLAYTLATLHNVHYYVQLMAAIRAAIARGELAALYHAYTGRTLTVA